VNRIRTCVQLAEELEPFNPEGARELRAIARQFARQLIERDRRALTHGVDAAGIVALVVLLVPGAALFWWARRLTIGGLGPLPDRGLVGSPPRGCRPAGTLEAARAPAD
jgi:hypothetical protein